MGTTSDETPARLKNKPSWLLTHVAVHAGRLVSEGFAAADARGYQYALLTALHEFGPSSQATLGRRCGIDRSDVVATVNELVDGKLAERTPDPADRRRNTIRITRAGLRKLRQLETMLGGVQDELLAPLSTAERDELTRLLTRLLDHHTAG